MINNIKPKNECYHFHFLKRPLIYTFYASCLLCIVPGRAYHVNVQDKQNLFIFIDFKVRLTNNLMYAFVYILIFNFHC